jgi:hypothetical protein
MTRANPTIATGQMGAAPWVAMPTNMKASPPIRVRASP